jgi:hypothetical protein
MMTLADERAVVTKPLPKPASVLDLRSPAEGGGVHALVSLHRSASLLEVLPHQPLGDPGRLRDPVLAHAGSDCRTDTFSECESRRCAVRLSTAPSRRQDTKVSLVIVVRH